MSWHELYERIENFLDKHDKERRLVFKEPYRKIFEELQEEFKETFVLDIVGSIIDEAYAWLREFKKAVRQVLDKYSLQGLTFSREFKSFIEDPKTHLKKKIVLYMHDLFRGRIELEEFRRKASAAVTTSLRTNMRTLYQSWVFLTILRLFNEKFNCEIVYPEHGYLYLERTGKQKTGSIPPNWILYIWGKGYLSFFIEAPRPLSWEDTGDLRKIWSLYTAFRPDMLVYQGMIMNIVQLGKEPPILRPNIIIECKELADWFNRSRDLRGPIAKPLSIMEWRSLWLEGLWDGLADILGVERKKVPEIAKERKSIRVKEYRLLVLYKKFYEPNLMFLISRCKVPPNIKKYLEDNDIVVYDNIEFDCRKLSDIVEILASKASFKFASWRLVKLSSETLELLEAAKEIFNLKKLSYDELIRRIVKEYLENFKVQKHKVLQA